jgi:Protein of unknown function (DUF1326)
MKSTIILILAIGLTGGMAFAQYDAATQDRPATKPDFDITASYIEACSCDMFCPCYFNTRSTHHHDGEYCRANLVLRTDKGYYKDTKLDGAKVWVANDLGSDWSTGKDSWMVIHYDPAVTSAQRAAFNDILSQLYSPVKWQHTDVDTQGFLWKVDTKTGEAHAKMNNGKGEVILERVQGDDAGHEVVVHNLKYWLAQSNNGFRMWKSKHEAFEGRGHNFSYDGTNGFLITIHFSGQAKAAAAD